MLKNLQFLYGACNSSGLTRFCSLARYVSKFFRETLGRNVGGGVGRGSEFRIGLRGSFKTAGRHTRASKTDQVRLLSL